MRRVKCNSINYRCCAVDVSSDGKVMSGVSHDCPTKLIITQNYVKFEVCKNHSAIFEREKSDLLYYLCPFLHFQYLYMIYANKLLKLICFSHVIYTLYIFLLLKLFLCLHLTNYILLDNQMLILDGSESCRLFIGFLLKRQCIISLFQTTKRVVKMSYHENLLPGKCS